MSELGSGGGTSYPASLDVDNSVEVDSSTTARADVPNDLAAAIIAVQNELGTDPAGSLSNVKTFLQTEHSTNGTHGDLTVGSLTLSKSLKLKQGADVASASDLAIDIDGNLFDVTGTTTINTMRTKGIGTSVVLQFDGACQLTYDATNFFIPGKANYTTAAGDVFMFYEYASADWRCTGYALANGKAIIGTTPSTATESAEGLVELATAAEVATGTDTARSITPATLDGLVNGKTDTTILAADALIFADASDSNKSKKDTVQGIIDLIPTAIFGESGVQTITSTGATVSSIPSGVKEVVVAFTNWQSTGSGGLLVQIGDSGGTETTGYIGQGTEGQSSQGFYLPAGSQVWHGIWTLRILDSTLHKWSCSLVASATTITNNATGGWFKDLSGELDRITFAVDGSANFNNTSVNVLWQK